MSTTLTTKIDERFRPGALTGFVKPGERYQVEKLSEQELRFRLLVPARRLRPHFVKRDGLTLLAGGGRLTRMEVDRALEEYP